MVSYRVHAFTPTAPRQPLRFDRLGKKHSEPFRASQRQQAARRAPAKPRYPGRRADLFVLSLFQNSCVMRTGHTPRRSTPLAT